MSNTVISITGQDLEAQANRRFVSDAVSAGEQISTAACILKELVVSSTVAQWIQIHDLAAAATDLVAQIETITCRADVADDLDGTWFRLEDEDGSVGVWFDLTGATTVPAGANAMDRTIEITGVVTNDNATDVGAAIVTDLDADSKFGVVNASGVLTITHATAGAVGDGVDGDSAFTAFTVTTNGTDASIPLVSIHVAADGLVAIAVPINLVNGLYIGNSSSHGVMAAGSADCMMYGAYKKV